MLLLGIVLGGGDRPKVEDWEELLRDGQFYRAEKAKLRNCHYLAPQV